MTDAEILELYVAYYDAFTANMAITMTSLVMIIGASILSARLNQTKIRQREIYTLTILFLTSSFLFQVFVFLPDLTHFNSQAIIPMLKLLETDLISIGFSKELIESTLLLISKSIEIIFRIFPAMIVLGILMQYSIAYIYFFALSIVSKLHV